MCVCIRCLQKHIKGSGKSVKNKKRKGDADPTTEQSAAKRPAYAPAPASANPFASASGSATPPATIPTASANNVTFPASSSSPSGLDTHGFSAALSSSPSSPELGAPDLPQTTPMSTDGDVPPLVPARAML